MMKVKRRKTKHVDNLRQGSFPFANRFACNGTLKINYFKCDTFPECYKKKVFGTTAPIDNYTVPTFLKDSSKIEKTL